MKNDMSRRHLSVHPGRGHVSQAQYSALLVKSSFVFNCTLFIGLFRAAPVAYGSSQARGRTGATAASL